MTQAQMPILGVIEKPRLLPLAEIKRAKTYREAVKYCWLHRRSKAMTQATLSELAGLYASHVSGYLGCGKAQRDLPAEKIAGFEIVTGNRFITQWLVMQADMNLMEQYLLERAA